MDGYISLHAEIEFLKLFGSVAQSCSTLCDSVDCSTPGFPVFHYLPEIAQFNLHIVSDVILPCHPLLPASPPALNFSQYQSLFQ